VNDAHPPDGSARALATVDSADAPTRTAPESLLTPHPFRIGELVSGRFRIQREIAEGGMGIVYLAIDEKLQQPRALKCAKRGYASHLPPEARSSLRVTHPNVCRVFEIHSAETRVGPIDFLTMEFIDGGTLSTLIRARGALPEPEAREIALQICAGVTAAHAEGLLHRDLKSNNVLMTTDHRGRVRAVVTDFGLAEEPAAPDSGPAWGGVAGTPAYLAPERWSGERATVASDIFALGVVLHELVAGHRPDVKADEAATHERVLDADLPRRWHRVIARCLDREPGRRYASAADVAHALTGSTARTRAIALASAALAVATVGLWGIAVPATPPARLAILPLEAPDADPQTITLVQGASYDLSSRLMRLRPRPPQLVVIPVDETRSLAGQEIERFKDLVGATHVLRGTVARQGDALFVRGSIVDTRTKVALRELSAQYSAADAGAVAPAFSAMVAAAFHLPRQRAAERIAPAAYGAYAEGMAALRSGPPAYARAIGAFERAAATDPQSVLPGAGLAEACYNAWVATSEPSWLVRGRTELAHAETLNADSLAVKLAAGKLNLVPGGYSRAVAEFQRAIQLDPVSAEAWSGLARAYSEMGDRDTDAATAFQKAIEFQPGYYRPFLDSANFYKRLGNYTLAETQFRQVIALAPQLLAGPGNLGGLFADMGRYAEAERELRRALEIDPRNRSVLNNMGALYQYMGRDEEALTFFDRARAVGPESHTVHLNVGDSLRRLGRIREAEASYRRGRELAELQLLNDPRNAPMRAFVAYYALRLGDRATAEREIVQAINFGAADKTVIRRAAICFEALGERERTLALLQSAPPDVLRELNRQPDVITLQHDPRFVALLEKAH
jgi:Flp pilus assembly protein TadD/TolB-like protein